jgi:hypothetical protein
MALHWRNITQPPMRCTQGKQWFVHASLICEHCLLEQHWGVDIARSRGFKVLLTKGLTDVTREFSFSTRRWSKVDWLLHVVDFLSASLWSMGLRWWMISSFHDLFPYWLGTWILNWKYSYSCSAFLKVMYSSWVTTEITAVILVPGKKHAYASALAQTL